ncbi:MAG: hypothetical protein KDI74_06665 [Gammaproteobacteria bacterium]|nr:hypothetical protein [Gammaproteobacteria bacterium]HXK56288.1 hypothetical protein [Gammaproteobacteria bacterium]
MKEVNNPDVNRDAREASNVFELIGSQCDLAMRATDALTVYLSKGSREAAVQVGDIGLEAETQRSGSLDILRREFSDSPLREGVHSAINSIVEIIHYVRTTAREMEMLRVGKHAHLDQLGALIKSGVQSLANGYIRLAAGETDVDDCVEETRKAEREAGDTYRNALSDLFNLESFHEALDAKEMHFEHKFMGHYLSAKADRHGAATKALVYVADILRRREILRHLSNAADRVLIAGNVLHEVAAQARSNRPQG